MKTQSKVAGISALAFLLLAICIVTPAHAITYYFNDGTPLCFSEVIEHVKVTQITGTYEWFPNQAYPPSVANLQMTVKDPSQREYYTKPMTEGEHSFAVLLNENVAPGEQLICFTPSPKFVAPAETPIKLRIELDQVQGKKAEKDTTKDVVEGIQKRRQVDGLDVFTFRETGGQMKDILQPRVYLQKIEGALSVMESALDKLVNDLNITVRQESRMRETSESTFTRVWVCAVLLIAVISGVLWMEFRFLKSTLRKKKLV